MMMKLISQMMLAAVFLFSVFSCNRDDDPDKERQWSGNVLIVNEGPFQTGTGTVDAYHSMTGEVQSDLFGNANGRPLGNILQSLFVFKDNIYLVVNNASRIEVVDYYTFISKGTIGSLTLPRYMVLSSEMKGYVSCWDNTIRVIDLEMLQVTGSIDAGSGPDEMVIAGNRLFVINSGGFGVDSTVTVIDLETDEAIATLEVGDRPVSISGDEHGILYILCAGKGWNGFPADGDTPARLVSLDPVTLEITELAGFTDPAVHPDQLVPYRGGAIFFFTMPDGIHYYKVPEDELSDGPFIPRPAMFYGLGCDQAEGVIYASDPLDYVQDGWIYRFWAESGIPIDSVRVGVIPGGFWFLNN